ncbi:choice-of-anchor M domain-containing protein [Nocardiopsis sp. ARC36]
MSVVTRRPASTPTPTSRRHAPSALRRARAFLLALAGAIGLTIAVASPAAAAVYDIDEGHVDVVHARLSGGSIVLEVKNDAVPWGDPDVPSGLLSPALTAIEVPNTPALGGYVLPESYSDATTHGLAFAGFGTDSTLSGSVTFTLVSASYSGSGAGGFTVSQGGTPLFTPSAPSVTYSGPVHEHVKWQFTAPGTYTLSFRAASGGATSTTVPFTFVVG